MPLCNYCPGGQLTLGEGHRGPGTIKGHTRQWLVSLQLSWLSHLFSFCPFFFLPHFFPPLLLISFCTSRLSVALELNNGDPCHIHHFPSQCSQDMLCCSWKAKQFRSTFKHPPSQINHLYFTSIYQELISSQSEASGASLVAQRLKRLPAMWETWVQSLGREDPLAKEMATHSSILAWRIPWTEEPGGLH